MEIQINQVNELIRNRRSVFPKVYNNQPIPRKIIEQILENANWAPTHRFTEPWRFKVFRGNALERLSNFLAEAYKETVGEEQFSEMKYKKTKQKPLLCDTVIAICMQRDPDERVPEWEEIAATACAVQNMWLSCTAYNIGCYWSSPKTIDISGDFLGLKQGERCLGFFYMGYYDPIDLPSKRQDIADKVEWIEK